METKHTPTPWNNSSTFGPNNIEAENGRLVANTGGYQDNVSDFNTTNKANAEFILKACNMHEELIDALDCAVNIMQHKNYPSEMALKIMKSVLARAKG